MSDENEVVTPAEEVVPEDQKSIEEGIEEATPATQDEPQQPTPATEEEGKPVGAATIVEMEEGAEQFPATEDNA